LSTLWLHQVLSLTIFLALFGVRYEQHEATRLAAALPLTSYTPMSLVNHQRALVFSLDDRYLEPFIVFFESLALYDSLPRNTNIYILCDQSLGRDSRSSIKQQNSMLNAVVFVDMNDIVPKRLPLRGHDHVTRSAFFRLFIASALPSHENEVVYMDADMLALKSCKLLFTIPLKYMIAAVDQLSIDDSYRLWGEHGGTYFNSGLLIMSLSKWRKYKLENLFKNIIANNFDKIRWWDQDILNIAFRDRWQRLPLKYNVTFCVEKYISKEYLDSSATIVHYTGSQKPWNSRQPSSCYASQWLIAHRSVFGRDCHVLAANNRLRMFILGLCQFLESLRKWHR